MAKTFKQKSMKNTNNIFSMTRTGMWKVDEIFLK